MLLLRLQYFWQFRGSNKRKLNNLFLGKQTSDWGYGDGSVGKAITPDTRCPWFEPHQRNLHQHLSEDCKIDKTKENEKGAWIGSSLKIHLCDLNVIEKSVKIYQVFDNLPVMSTGYLDAFNLEQEN